MYNCFFKKQGDYARINQGVIIHAKINRKERIVAKGS